jgi:hypothetical protein
MSREYVRVGRGRKWHRLSVRNDRQTRCWVDIGVGALSAVCRSAAAPEPYCATCRQEDRRPPEPPR